MAPYLAGDTEAFQASIEKYINDLLTAERFRNELQLFLESHGLPSKLTTEPELWQIFINKYLSSVAVVL
jgi:adenosine deaminase